MKNQLSNVAHSIYSLLFTPKSFFEDKCADDLKAALPYLFVGIVLGSIQISFASIPLRSTFIFEYIYFVCANLIIFLFKVLLVYIIIKTLGETISYRNILATMMFVSFISIFGLIYYEIFILSNLLFRIDFMLYLYGSIIVMTILYIWTSYCAIIGLSTMQQIDRRNAMIGVLVVFSFFYIRHLFYDISTILAFL